MIIVRDYIDAFKRSLAEARDARKLKEFKNAKFNVALVFNRLWAYKAPHWRNCRWMCPSCNKIHGVMDELSFLTGVQYPACCEFPEGHRQYDFHATKGAM